MRRSKALNVHMSGLAATELLKNEQNFITRLGRNISNLWIRADSRKNIDDGGLS